MPAYSHECRKFAAQVDKWPSPGEVLPVTVDPDDLGRVEVLWDEMPTIRDAAKQQAEQMAPMLRQQGGQPGAAGAPPETAGMVQQLQQAFPGAIVNVGPQPGGPPGAVDATGLVDQTRFEQLKAQILEQADLDGG